MHYKWLPEKQLEHKLYEHAPYDPWLLSQDTSYLRFKRFVLFFNKKWRLKTKQNTKTTMTAII